MGIGLGGLDTRWHFGWLKNQPEQYRGAGRDSLLVIILTFHIREDACLHATQ